MLINCTSKGCYKLQEPYYNPTDNKVYCSECDQPLHNTTQFLVNQLKSAKKIGSPDASKAYSMRCTLCKGDARPFIKDKNIHCSLCQKELPLSSTFKKMLLVKLKESVDD